MAEKAEELKSEKIQLVIFRLRDEEFGVDISSVKEIIEVGIISSIPEAPSFIQGVTNLRGQVIAVIDLAKQFGLTPQENLPKTAKIVVTEVNGQKVGMLVDEVPEIVKISKESIEPTPELIQSEIQKDYIQGVGKLEQRLIIFLNLEKVLAPHEVNEVVKVSQLASIEE